MVAAIAVIAAAYPWYFIAAGSFLFGHAARRCDWSLPAASFHYFRLTAEFACCIAGWIYFLAEEVLFYIQFYTPPRLQHL